jgi:hypothetical protein
MGQSLNPFGGSGGKSESYCVLVIPSPTDAVVYGCFRSIARKWQPYLLSEQLWIEGDVPISSGFLLDSPPRTISRLLDAEVAIIAGVSLELTGLTVSYRRSGGHGPPMYRQSFFDDLLITKRDGAAMSTSDVQEMIEELHGCLEIGSVMATGDFASIANDLDLPTSGMTQGFLPL